MDRGTFRAIAGELRQRISSGQYAPGATIPAETSLVAEFNVARGTVRSALQELEREHLIEVIPGQGRRVASKATDAPLPAYERVAATLRSRILTGAYQAGQPLPSEAEVCSEFSISRNTARHAYARLVEEGLVVRRQGAGAFVADLSERGGRDGAWRVLSRRSIYDSPWIHVGLADVALPSGQRFQHHTVSMPAAAMTVVLNDEGSEVLLSWRHRFVPDVWNWELPGGLIDEGETPEQTAAREIIEETGYRARLLTPLVVFEPMVGMVSNPHHVFMARGVDKVGVPTERDEGHFQWVATSRIRKLITSGDVKNSGTLVGLLHYLALSRDD